MKKHMMVSSNQTVTHKQPDETTEVLTMEVKGHEEMVCKFDLNEPSLNSHPLSPWNHLGIAQ